MPKEISDLEKRVALSPASVAVLKKAGFKVLLVEEGAGHGAQFTVSASLTCKSSHLLWVEIIPCMSHRRPGLR